jgi:hypothetical protein
MARHSAGTRPMLDVGCWERRAPLLITFDTILRFVLLVGIIPHKKKQAN